MLLDTQKKKENMYIYIYIIYILYIILNPTPISRIALLKQHKAASMIIVIVML